MLQNKLHNETKRKVYIYDTTRAHSRMLLMHYKDTFEFIRCTKSTKFSMKEIGNISIAFVFINTSEDILKLHYIKSKVDKVFLGSNKKNIDYSVYKLKGITYLNLFETKTELLKYIDFKLTELGMIENIVQKEN